MSVYAYNNNTLGSIINAIAVLRPQTTVRLKPLSRLTSFTERKQAKTAEFRE